MQVWVLLWVGIDVPTGILFINKIDYMKYTNKIHLKIQVGIQGEGQRERERRKVRIRGRGQVHPCPGPLIIHIVVLIVRIIVHILVALLFVAWLAIACSVWPEYEYKRKRKNVGTPALSSLHSHFIPSWGAGCHSSLVASPCGIVDREGGVVLVVGGVAVRENLAPSSMVQICLYPWLPITKPSWVTHTSAHHYKHMILEQWLMLDNHPDNA
jgi:hypothetical protein